MKTLIQTSKVLILSIAVLTAVSYVQAAWNDPSQEPTGGNTAAPINVSNSNQNKDGGFSAASLVGGIITSPEYCIGSSSDNLDCIESWPGGGSGDVTIDGFRVTAVNFDGTTCPNEGDTCTIRSSQNVSSVIKDYKEGTYIINFTNPYSNSNYILSGASSYTYGDPTDGVNDNRGSSVEIRALDFMKNDKVTIENTVINTEPRPLDMEVVTVMILGQ